MKFATPLTKATLIRRYKRFLADVVLSDGSMMTVHCPNTGSMKNCLAEGEVCWLLDSKNPKRKYRYSLEYVTTPTGAIAGINSARANKLVVEAIEKNAISELTGYSALKTEQVYGSENSRVDIYLTCEKKRDLADCYVEIKSVTLEEEPGYGFFPDAVSLRGQKHLRELALMVQQGSRAVLFFCVQHSAIKCVDVARHIDAKYGQLFDEAIKMGVEVLAYKVDMNADEISVSTSIPVVGVQK